MIRTELTAPIPVSIGGYSAVAIAPDTDFEVRWAAWRTRGVAHERAVRRTLILVASLAGTLTTAVAIAYTRLHP